MEVVTSLDFMRFRPATAFLSIAALVFGYAFMRRKKNTIQMLSGIQVTPSPRPLSSTDSSKSTAYPMDYFPGGRDVKTPYGSLRVFEFGPEGGERVLFIHGISTPCPIFKNMALELVERGYRVCLFDLWGRGWSDSPHIPHDEGLFLNGITMIMSQLNWHNATVLGYSLGGGIAVSFAHHFPQLVNRLILVAPAGLLPKKSMGVFARLAIDGHFPEAILTMVMGRVQSKKIKENSGSQTQKEINYEDLRNKNVDPDIANVIAWQSQTHPGFARSFASSFRHGPIFDRHELWDSVGKSFKKPILLVWGTEDDTCKYELSKQATKYFPQSSLISLPHGHDVMLFHDCHQEIANWLDADLKK
eukprot:TRINITY_DN6996_c0_g1_i1.p1 TRINITY_DN6996_c0_g1~~TRINITY_DN6996_c0_g1_i1.p1  ORF type:complete len:359 (+),score=95.22 TRINITY_DN6996_c0_g1_i1:106-1182(+)